ncbi:MULTISPECIES: hypothetical protein [Stenotrophomonas]|jgi:hypothetical protein|uniref:Exported protein n=1 Tax=Stenotrophomonas acidaminiphila TaxID=128780 RepID=A0A0R0DZB6_9GAMM|nr:MULTISPECIES: hypothetical protein [Stenotrophomonas]ALJ29243.1 exported protein [Stenotrophomonas acidaminiphila]KRG82643.1 hypothetical protein ABB33_15630 [Stenotrophomonas acidaminiphila]MCA7023170.1 hypothetical protein [Stenotrophomonas acidaminiphila]MCE4076681.1 hypothetical protein [Stenotrophomonas acidaminiphila]QOF97964.1 hypothetical protein H7691_15240 [Stenotrophomonas sp. CW117]
MRRPSLLARLRHSRRTSLLLFAATLASLVVAAVWFIKERSALADAYQRLGDRNQLLSEAKVREQETRLRVEHANSARQLLASAQANGLVPGAWGERLINLRQSQMHREEALPLLATVQRSPDHLFGAESFEIAVTHPDEGLFDPPGSLDRRPAPLSLTLRGSLLFQTADDAGTHGNPLP